MLWEKNPLNPERQFVVEEVFGHSGLQRLVKYWQGVFGDLVPHLEMGKLLIRCFP